MASKVPSLSEAQFIGEIVKRLDGQVSAADVKRVVKALKDEAVDCLINGYKVSLNGLLRLEPKYVAPKDKNDLVRNPATGETQKRGKNVPASFKARAVASRTIAKQFPSIRSGAGQALAAALAAPAQKAAVKSGRKGK